MQDLVNPAILTTLYTSVHDQLFAAPPTFHIFVTHYQTPHFLQICLTSLFSQKTSTPFRVWVVDDASNQDAVHKLLDAWSQKEPARLTVLKQTERKGKGQNLLTLLERCTPSPEDIIGIVDGDDWLDNSDALERVVHEYRTTDCWVTYGSYRCSSDTLGSCTAPLSASHILGEANGRGFRDAPWVFSHFFTAKAFLWRSLPKDLMVFDGQVEPFAPADQVFNLALAEMASTKHIRQISDILYVYNNENPLNDCRVRPTLQESYDSKNRKRPPFAPLQRPLLDFLVMLPCRGRAPLLHATLRRLKEEESISSFSTQIVLVEHSETPAYKSYAKEQGLAWIYIPFTSDPMTPLGQFNRGLCFDIGFLYGQKASFYVCHDNDLLVPLNFWSKLKYNLARGPYAALQTYSDRFVWQTSEEVSQRLLETPEWFQTEFDVETHCTQNGPGAKGGSLTLSRDMYLAVGGHDPHLFFGYAAEDAFFWAKLELLVTLGYADEPRIPLVHLWHPNAANLNPLKHEMDKLYHVFRAIPESYRRDYLARKAADFQERVAKRA